MGTLSNKNIIVTGGSSGIGQAMVEKFLAEGARVVNWSRNHPSIAESDSFLHLRCDITSEDEVNSAAAKSIDWLGKVDVLVNNSGMGIAGNLMDIKTEDWKYMFEVNVHGLFYASRAVVPNMISNNAGHIINISSIAGLNGVKGFSGYVGTKHAVRGISHSWYAELRDYGIKVSTVYPGSIQTKFFDEIPGVETNEHMMRAEDVAKSVAELIDTSPNYFPVDLELRPLKPRG